LGYTSRSIIIVTSVLRHLYISYTLSEGGDRLAAAAAAGACRGACRTRRLDVLQPAPTDVIVHVPARKSASVSGRPSGVACEGRHGNTGRRRAVLMARRPGAAVATGNRRCSRAAVAQRRR